MLKATFSPDGRTITANDEGRHVLYRIDVATRKVIWSYGHLGVKSSARGYLNTPDDAYPLAFEGETRWVTAYATSRLRKMGSDPLAVRPLDATVPLRLVLSRVSYPVRNVVTIRVTTPRRITIALDTLTGRFDPRRSGPVDTSWAQAASVVVEPGEQLVKLRIPWDLADSVAPLTNWAHLIQGRPVNIYHAIHVRRLRQMASLVAISRFESYARIWTEDMCAWASMPRYAGLLTTDDAGAVARPSVHC